MNRRQIFSRLSALVVTCLAMPKMGWSKAKNSINPSVDKGDEAYTTVREFQSMLYPNKKFKNIQDFWNHHPDKVSAVLKKEYLDKGYLKSHSELLSDGRTIRQTKVFKSQKLYTRYQKSMKAYCSQAGNVFKENLKRIS